MAMWNRREVLWSSVALLGASGAVTATAPQPQDPAGKPVVRARDVSEHLRRLGAAWVDAQKTVDTFKCGDPETPIRGIAVGWMPYTWALMRAVELGCNLFVTHEPVFYDHLDRDRDVFALGGAERKRALIEREGLVIFRCHDVWDQFPGTGIVDAWAKVLGFSEPLAGQGYYRVFAGGGRTALSIARDVARRTRRFGQEAVQLVGPADRPVHRVALGCGAITPFRRFVASYEADLAICTDDGFVQWRDGALAIDLEIPAIVVNHPVSEEEGIRLLAEHLRGAFPSVKIAHIPERCMYRLVSG